MADEQSGRGTGAFHVETSAAQLLGAAANEFEGPIEPDESVGFEVFVPGTYRPATPPGVLVYISPGPTGRVPPPWRGVLRMHNLIWVGANDSGNQVDVGRRVELALMAPSVAARHHEIDTSRVFLSGFSGGGRVASMMMPVYPHVYAGAIFICGANPVWGLQPHQVAALSTHPLVFLTGSGDFNLLDTQFAHESFKASGIPGARLMVIDGLEHALPNALAMNLAVEELAALAEPDGADRR